MFKQIFSALSKGETLDHAFSEFTEMLDHAQWMFIRANEVLRRKASADELRESIYRRDQSINDLLRSIRRKILRHLSINPGSDAASCLALMSVAKDAERIGDYCKNVFEVGQFYREDFHVEEYHDPLESIQGDVVTLFSDVSKAFKDSSTTDAKASIKKADDIRERCDKVIEELLNDESSMQTHEAVAYSLLARHYKRVAAHLANIATSIFGEIEDLDFRK